MNLLGKNSLKATTIVVFLSFLIGFQISEVAKGNPTWGVYPTEPNLDTPILILNSPRNHTSFNSGESISLNFNVEKPGSWNQTVAPFGSPAIGHIDSVNVSLNGRQYYQDFLGADYLNGIGVWSKSYSISIDGLNSGANAIEVTVFAQTFYFNQYSPNNTVSHYPMNVTDTIYLNYSKISTATKTPAPSYSVNLPESTSPQTSSTEHSETPSTTPSSMPNNIYSDFTPMAIVVGTPGAIVVVAGLLAYLTKRRGWKQ